MKTDNKVMIELYQLRMFINLYGFYMIMFSVLQLTTSTSITSSSDRSILAATRIQ